MLRHRPAENGFKSPSFVEGIGPSHEIPRDRKRFLRDSQGFNLVLAVHICGERLPRLRVIQGLACLLPITRHAIALYHADLA